MCRAAAPPARGAEPRHPRGPRLKAIEAPNLGCVASWVCGDPSGCVSLVGSWQPLSSAVAASSCMKNTSPASAGCPRSCGQRLALSRKPYPRFSVSSWSKGEQLGLTKPLRNQTVEIRSVLFFSPTLTLCTVGSTNFEFMFS